MRKDSSPLIRNAADWARDWGWVSPRKAENRARELRAIADAIDGALEGDDGAAEWVRAIRSIAAKIDPVKTREATRRRGRKTHSGCVRG